MDNTIGTSLDKFASLGPRYMTHMTRFANLTLRHSKRMKLIVDALVEYPEGSFEIAIVMKKMLEELRAISEEAMENIDDVQSDLAEMESAFDTIRKEQKKIENDKPKS